MTKPYIDVDELKKMEAEILHGTMTNEEWRTATTKQLAEWLAFLVYEICICKNGGRSVEEEISKLQKMQNSPCELCGCNPKNGGSGLCNCTLACPKIT